MPLPSRALCPSASSFAARPFLLSSSSVTPRPAKSFPLKFSSAVLRPLPQIAARGGCLRERLCSSVGRAEEARLFSVVFLELKCNVRVVLSELSESSERCVGLPDDCQGASGAERRTSRRRRRRRECFIRSSEKHFFKSNSGFAERDG